MADPSRSDEQPSPPPSEPIDGLPNPSEPQQSFPSPSSSLFSHLRPASSTPSAPTSDSFFPSMPQSSASLLASSLSPIRVYYESQLPYQQAAAPMTKEEQAYLQAQARLQEMPEKCFSWCSQNAMAQPTCRMVCLRKRALGQSKEEHTERLRASRRALASPEALARHMQTQEEEPTASSRVLQWLQSPISTLHQKVMPYSIIYVRGSPDGAIGRYMEELERDDGNYDFKHISRGAVARKASGRRSDDEEGMEYMEWGDQESLLHLPLTSVLSPILSLPANLSRLFSPSLRFISAYTTSFTDGGQLRMINKFYETVQNNGASEMLSKIEKVVQKRAEETREKREEMLKQRQQERVERMKDMKDVGKEVEGKGGDGQ
ncbi:hypothetical protein L202_01235 [Cryptococcus amylolentus CBS 6039]|uniref:Uncharacterized protein n=1 Tax=Cryptococcus amylolentus CBS 6039 TaxID=1295533 RepID=A0A1E3I317_9TREE|nr:hypothetical protein L202_01235 [Cryptococcus amylolentus CBS 6039]ODN83004.1 hypothetical protein L202_01235 [Cryptococcus amylolentus CBS 6039]